MTERGEQRLRPEVILDALLDQHTYVVDGESIVDAFGNAVISMPEVRLGSPTDATFETSAQSQSHGT